jgi:hypothetical protein
MGATGAPRYRLSYKNMIQRAVSPQAQSLCFAVQARQDQYSHQIHLRWFTSSTNRAMIQRRIWLRDTQPP